MALDQAANFVREQVTSAISAGDTTINVADASPFPVPPEGYNIVVWDGAAYVRPDQDPDVEIMRVTDTDTTNDTLTVARGQEGTSDFNHPDTSVVVVAQTAKMIADIASEKISNPVTETVDANGNDVTNVGALDVDGLTDGIAGANNSISTVWGDEGQYEFVSVFNFGIGQTINVSSTSFSEIGDRYLGPGGSNLPAVDNLSDTLSASVAFRADSFNNGASSVTVRYFDASNTEVTATSEGNTRGPIGDDGVPTLRLEAQVDAGDVDISRVVVYLYRKIQRQQ